MDTTTFSDLPLRTQKRARTRLGLVEALTARLETRQLDDISVDELCREVGISQATFFNYFPNKPAVLTRFIQLWSLKVGHLAAQVEARHASPLKAIEALFADTAADITPRPRMMLETIAHQARMPADLELAPIELAERLLFIPDAADVMALSDRGLGGILPVMLGRAVAAGELPADSDVQTLTVAVASAFFGVPLIFGSTQPELIGPMYQQQLQLLWAGARGVK